MTSEDFGITSYQPTAGNTLANGSGSWIDRLAVPFMDNVTRLYTAKKQAELLKSANPNAFALADQYGMLTTPQSLDNTTALALARQQAQQQQAAQQSILTKYALIGGGLLLAVVVLKKVL